VRDGIFQIGYAGSLGRYLHEGVDSNQVLPTSTPYASDCLAPGQSASATYDYDPCLNNGLTVTWNNFVDYLRPYKGWEGLGNVLYTGNSSLQLATVAIQVSEEGCTNNTQLHL